MRQFNWRFVARAHSPHCGHLHLRSIIWLQVNCCCFLVSSPNVHIRTITHMWWLGVFRWRWIKRKKRWFNVYEGWTQWLFWIRLTDRIAKLHDSIIIICWYLHQTNSIEILKGPEELCIDFFYTFRFFNYYSQYDLHTIFCSCISNIEIESILNLYIVQLRQSQTNMFLKWHCILWWFSLLIFLWYFNPKNYNVKSVCLILMNRDTDTNENKDRFIFCQSKRKSAVEEVN